MSFTFKRCGRGENCRESSGKKMSPEILGSGKNDPIWRISTPAPFQNLKVAFWQEPFVRGGCPSHSLEYSWVHLTVSLLGQTVLVKRPFSNFDRGIFFSWEPALETLNSQDAEAEAVKKSIAIFSYKQWLLSLDMKTKIVQHVSRIYLSHFKFWI